jgi:DNA invertase Pin-like site-specific DNA recombinase
MRSAIYIRVSSDKQDVRNSVARQRAACRTWAAAHGSTILQEFVDEAISGGQLGRPGLQAVLSALRKRGPAPWDALLIDDASRLDRGGHLAELVRLFASRSVQLISVDTGRDLASDDERLMVHVQAGLSEHYLHELGRRTRAGLAQRALKGYWTGGRVYGYRLVKEEGGTRVEVDKDQATTVRRLFREYARGAGLRELASVLNVEHLPSPRGGTWDQSAIRAMLRNPRYRGEWRWNVSRWRKAPQSLLDPVSGQSRAPRKVRKNAAADWIAEERPDLRIVAEAVWREVAARFAGRVGRSRRPPARSPLAGLAKCGCGAPLVRSGGGRGAHRLRCAHAANRGDTVCDARSIPEVAVLGAIADWIERSLATPAATRAAIRTLERQRRRTAKVISPSATRATVARLEREIARLVDGLATGADFRAVRSGLADRQTALDQARGELAATAIPALRREGDPVRADQAAAALRRAVRGIRAGGDKAREALRGALAGVTVRHVGDRIRLEIAVRPAVVGLTDSQIRGSGGGISPLCGRIVV